MRSLFFILALVPTLTLSAWSIPCGCDPFEGIYAGAAIGVGTSMVSQRRSTSVRFNGVGVPPDRLELVSHGDFYRIQPWGEIYTGWGLRFCNWLYLGGRFGINFSSFKVTGPASKASANCIDPGGTNTFSTNLSDKASTKTWSAEYTLDFKPGIVWCDRTMLFGIIGAAFNRTTLNGTSLFVNSPQNTPPTSSLLQLRGRKTSTGFRGGIGLEQMLSRCISLNISYVYTSYWNLKATAQGDTQSVANGHNTRVTSRAHRQTTSAGLSYYF